MKAYAHYYIAAGAMIALSSGILAILSGAVMAGSFMVTGGCASWPPPPCIP